MTKNTKIRRPLPCGLRTHRRDFVMPILTTLAALGGTGSTSQVLDGVEERMRGTLNRFDYEYLTPKRTRGEYRWRNTARWTRASCVKLGLMRNDSPTGVWELSRRGEKMLSELR